MNIITLNKENTMLKNVKCARCVRCGKEYEAVPNLTNCSCGGILDIVYDYDYIKAHFTKETLKNRVNPTMWRYRELLPVEDTTPDTPLRVGWSPLYEEDRLAKLLGLKKLWVKDDGQNPTASLKDRASAMAVAKAKEAGADSVTTEFFCMESRADDRLKARYAAMSEVLGYDIHQFYMENSKQQGYKRLNRAIKAPIIHRMRELTHSLGMRFHVSDAFCRECNDACNCCGVPPEWGVSQTGNIGNAIIIAREKGFVTFSDVMESINKYFDFPWVGACGYNTGSNKARALLYDTTMAQWLRSNWNDTKKGTSPARAYGGVLVPDGKDENGDVIYRYAIKR